ncbi:hypothetical protein D3C78_1744800 [compost metagenome]
MGDTDGGDEQGRDYHPQGRALDAVLGPCTLPEQNVQCPADTRPQRIGGAHWVECLAAVTCRQQQQQACDGQGNPQEIDRSARG